MRAEVKGHLDLLILSVVARAPRHGYAIVEELHERSGGTFAVPEGSIYPALYRLERAGLLESRWTTEAGRRRRVYAITGKGTGSLERRRDEWRSFSHAVEAVVA